MFCPACGSEANSAQKFCRACGISLEGLAERVAAHQGLPATKSEEEIVTSAVGKWVAAGGLGLLALTVAFVLFNVAFRIMSDNTLELIAPKLFAIGLMLIVIGAGTMVLPRFLRKERLVAQKQPTTLPTTLTNELPPPTPQMPFPSVTDATTRNLEPVLQERARVTPSSELKH